MIDDGQERTCPAIDEEGWSRSYEATHGNPPRPLILRAVEMPGRPGDTLELGFGAGNEVPYLLGKGFRVTAVDADAGAVRSLGKVTNEALRVVQGTFDEFDFEPGAYDLVSAQYALPFNPPATFGRLLRSIRPGGLFAGNLWGERDDWNTPGSGGAFHRRDDALRLFERRDLVVFDEHEEEAQLACRGTRHGHWYEIIARRPGQIQRA